MKLNIQQNRGIAEEIAEEIEIVNWGNKNFYSQIYHDIFLMHGKLFKCVIKPKTQVNHLWLNNINQG